MKFRPCIDIHNGKVKQIVGGSLADQGDMAKENFVSELDAAFYAGLYRDAGLIGGHIILLNPVDSQYYKKNLEQASLALQVYPKGLQIGGGINDKNAADFLHMGASHVIVTSYVFKDGIIQYDNLDKLIAAVGRKHMVLDLSCRKKGNDYYIVTDRWQNFTDVLVTKQTLENLKLYCDEFLIHAVDAEGKALGIEKDLVKLLGEFDGIPITYAGGVGSFRDLEELKLLSKNKLDVTIGSALDLFGGSMEYSRILTYCK